MAQWSDMELAARLTALLERRRIMLEYLKLRLELDDLHGVQDAASDIREIDAQAAMLRSLTLSK